MKKILISLSLLTLIILSSCQSTYLPDTVPPRKGVLAIYHTLEETHSKAQNFGYLNLTMKSGNNKLFSMRIPSATDVRTKVLPAGNYRIIKADFYFKKGGNNAHSVALNLPVVIRPGRVNLLNTQFNMKSFLNKGRNWMSWNHSTLTPSGEKKAMTLLKNDENGKIWFTD